MHFSSRKTPGSSKKDKTDSRPFRSAEKKPPGLYRLLTFSGESVISDHTTGFRKNISGKYSIISQNQKRRQCL